MLEGRRVVLGVCGGIAAYKAVEVCRRLVDAGAHVTPVLTSGARRFVGRATFDALASEPAWTSLFDQRRPIPHTDLARRADLVVVAPATARLLGAYAAGISDDLLTNVLLATRAPVLLAPAMHTEMWEHPAVVDNVATLVRRGVTMVGPDSGHLAGGDIGAGRLAAPTEIVAAATSLLGAPRSTAAEPAGDLAGRSVLVTAGGTREPIDPVRYLGNRSSGKQGHALARRAARRGARVTLVTTTDRTAEPGVEVVRVETAAEMDAAVRAHALLADVVVMAAAVADFTPAVVAPSKLKKADGPPRIELLPTVDILAGLGRSRRPGQVIVGFAAETDDLVAHAGAKLAAKGVDLIVANDVSAARTGFGHETNAVIIVSAEGTSEVPLAEKAVIADAVLDAVVARLARDSRPPYPKETDQ